MQLPSEHFQPPGASAQPVSDVGGVSLETPIRGLPPEETRQVLQWAADWVRQTLPASYEGEKDWGEQKRVYAGVKLTTGDNRLSTKRRWRELNHGRWIKYSVDLQDPSLPERLNIQVNRAWMDADQRVHFDALITAHVNWTVQQERWTLGTRLVSVSARGTANVQMQLSGSVGLVFDLTKIPPDVVASPVIESSHLTLTRLKVDRISKIGGEVAEAFGEVVEHLLQEEYLPRQQAKITERMNRQIHRRPERLRFSASDWLARTWQPARPEQVALPAR